ncbi:MAG: hypothetical protein WA869_15880 [Alloacidobacterium sp.]|jgi:hypothetical protein
MNLGAISHATALQDRPETLEIRVEFRQMVQAGLDRVGPENLPVKASAKSGWLRIQSVNRGFALTLTIDFGPVTRQIVIPAQKEPAF